MHSVIRRSFALPFGRRGGRLSLPTNCPCRTVGLHHAAKNLHTRLGPALFTFHGIRNRRVRYVFNRTARPAVNPADVAGDNLTWTTPVRPSLPPGDDVHFAGPALSRNTPRCQPVVRYDENETRPRLLFTPKRDDT